MEVCVEREREASISRSYEGSDIVYENLLGDLLQIENNDSHSLHKKSNGINGNFITTTAGHTIITTPHSKTIDISSDIEDIFDDDLFDLNKEEIEKHSNYLLTDADDDFEEEESVEGLSVDHTTIIKVDVFDSILMDLEEKTKEMELEEKKKAASQGNHISKSNTKSKSTKTKGKTKNKSNKKERKKKQNKSHKKKKSLIQLRKDMDEHKESLENLKRFETTEDDKEMLNIDMNDNTMNPWILRKWEFNDNHKRRSLRQLLSSLNEDILWEEIMNEKEWEIVKRKDIIYDDDMIRYYKKALNIFNPDKSISRGDNIEQQIICAWIYNALQNAYNNFIETEK